MSFTIFGLMVFVWRGTAAVIAVNVIRHVAISFQCWAPHLPHPLRQHLSRPWRLSMCTLSPARSLCESFLSVWPLFCCFLPELTFTFALCSRIFCVTRCTSEATSAVSAWRCGVAVKKQVPELLPVKFLFYFLHIWSSFQQYLQQNTIKLEKVTLQVHI